MFIKWFKSDFVRNSLTLVTGTAVAQMIPVGLQPLLRRIYAPEDFGLFAIYMSFIGILGVAATLRYELAVVIPDNDEDASNVVGVSILTSFFYVIILSILLWLFEDPIIRLLDLPEAMHFWIHIIPLSILFFSSYRTLNYWLIRKKKFRASSVNKISRRSAEGLVQLGLGFKSFNMGLLIGDVVGHTVNLVAGVIQVFRSGFSFRYLNKNKLRSMASRYSEFPKFNALPAMLNAASGLLPVLMINKFYSESITGQFDLTRMVLALPVALISITISQVLLQKIVEKRNNRQPVRRDVMKLTKVLLSLALIGILIISLWGLELFELLFGDEWDTAGRFSEVLIFSFAIKFIVTPLSSVLVALERIKIASIWQASYFFVICGLFFLSDISIERFLLIYVGLELVAYVTYYFLILHAATRYDAQIVKSN